MIIGTMEIDEGFFFELEAMWMPKVLKENEEYQENEERLIEILNDNENLMQFLDRNQYVALSAEDTKQLKEYMELDVRQNDIWRIELFKYAQAQMIKMFLQVK